LRPIFEEAVVLAVNHSGDSDSTGAIVGNICGALYGRLVKELERTEDKEHMMVRFDEKEPRGAPVSVRDRDGESATSAAE
jgi:ADP-ribosylglycohydrolase